MTPYRERREKGHYDSPTNEPASVHSHHLPGLLTGTSSTSGAAAVEITGNFGTPMTEIDLETLTKAELIYLARDRHISPANAAMSKAELIAALEGGA